MSAKLRINKLSLSLVTLLVLYGGALAQDRAWKTFSPPHTNWSIYAPGILKPDAEALDASGNKGSYSFNDGTGFFAVIYRDAPKIRLVPFAPSNSTYFKKERDDAVLAAHGQLIKDQEFTIGDKSGREIYIKIPSGSVIGNEGERKMVYRIERVRMFFFGKRFYALLVVLPEDQIDSPEVNKFMTSFTVKIPPTAVADSYSTDEDTTLTVNAARGILANDKDAQGIPLTVSASKPITTTAHGSLALNADGSFTYKPNPDYNGKDSFSYKANNGTLDSDQVTVTITVNPVNDPPVLTNVPPTATVDELTPMKFTATATDIDSPASSLRFSLSKSPAGAAINPVTGVFTWTPTEAQGPGNYTFQVNVSDGEAMTGSTINVTVREVNTAPVLAAISNQTIDELKPFSMTVNGSDADIPANNLTFSLDPNSPAGMTINPKTGVIVWTPTEAQGPDDYLVTVRLTDNGTPVLSDKKIFNIHVNEVNSPPKLAPISNKTVDEETLLTFKVTANDADLPANTLSYSLINAPPGAIINPADGTFTWTPTEAQGPGSYPVKFRVTDNGAPALSDEETMTITVNEVNKAPLAFDANINTDEDTAVSLTLKATDADIPLNTLTYSIVNAPSHGKLSGTAPNLIYTPNPDYNGSDNFTFRVNDGLINSNTATVNINIKPVNDPPVANPDTAVTDEDAAVTIDVLANDTDVDGDRIVLTGVSNAVNGRAEIIDGKAKFTPDLHFHGVGSFSYTISDGNGGTATGSIKVTVNPAQPKP